MELLAIIVLICTVIGLIVGIIIDKVYRISDISVAFVAALCGSVIGVLVTACVYNRMVRGLLLVAIVGFIFGVIGDYLGDKNSCAGFVLGLVIGICVLCLLNSQLYTTEVKEITKYKDDGIGFTYQEIGKTETTNIKFADVNIVKDDGDTIKIKIQKPFLWDFDKVTIYD